MFSFLLLICLLHGEPERAEVLKTVPIIPAYILFPAQNVNEYICVNVCINLI